VAKKQKRYTREFRQKAVRLAAESDKPITEVARDLEVAYNTLHGWMVKARVTGHAARAQQPARSDETPDQEVRRLRRELEDVTVERDFLKKAAAFFARMNK
jgi:transposase